MNAGRMGVRPDDEQIEKVVFLGTLGRKWQWMKDIKLMWNTE